jgi:putative MFS transporter
MDEARTIVTEIEIECGSPQQEEYQVAEPAGEKAVRANVFSKAEIGRRILLASAINIVTGLALYGFVSWIPTFLVKQGFNIASTLGYTTLMSIGGPCGAVLSHVLADRIGRKAGLVVSSVGIIGFGWFYCNATAAPILVAAGFGLVTSIYFLLSIGTATYVPELFETSYRMRAVGLASTLGRVASMISPFIIVAAFETWGILGIYTVLSISLVLMCALVLVLGVETKGRSLEAISRPQQQSPFGEGDGKPFGKSLPADGQVERGQQLPFFPINDSR